MKKGTKITLAIALPVVAAISLAFFNIDSPNYNPANIRVALMGLFFICAIVAVMAYIAQQSGARHNAEKAESQLTVADKQALYEYRRKQAATSAMQSIPSSPPKQFDPIPEDWSLSEGPGRYRIDGVDRETKMDTTWYCNADSAANAKVKGELQGIIVTAVKRER